MLQPIIDRVIPTLVFCSVFWTMGGNAITSAEDSGFQKKIAPLLTARCVNCHGAEKHEANVNFSSIVDEQTCGPASENCGAKKRSLN